MIERVPGLRTGDKNEVIVLNLGVPTTSHKPHTLCTRYITKKVPGKNCFPTNPDDSEALFEWVLCRNKQAVGPAKGDNLEAFGVERKKTNFVEVAVGQPIS